MAEQQKSINFKIPEEVIAGVYANQVTVWHTPHEFTMDFSVMPTIPFSNESEETTQALVVARVRVPTSVIFQIARAISENVSNYEKQFGPINTHQPDISTEDL